MNTIIWALNNDHDNIQDLCEYISRFGEGVFENTAIAFHLNVAPGLPDLQLSGAHRKNLFLCVKESLHNILKHSGAGNAWVDIALQGPNLHIAITDDGRGLHPAEAATPTTVGIPATPAAAGSSTIPGGSSTIPRGFGNGLKNIMRRMYEIGGQVRLEKTCGLCVRLQLPLIAPVTE